MKKAGFNGYVYDFSVDYDAIAVDDIKDIHKYLMKKKWYSKIRTYKKVWIYENMIFNRISVFITFSKYNPVKLYFNE